MSWFTGNLTFKHWTVMSTESLGLGEISRYTIRSICPWYSRTHPLITESVTSFQMFYWSFRFPFCEMSLFKFPHHFSNEAFVIMICSSSCLLDTLGWLLRLEISSPMLWFISLLYLLSHEVFNVTKLLIFPLFCISYLYKNFSYPIIDTLGIF